MLSLKDGRTCQLSYAEISFLLSELEDRLGADEKVTGDNQLIENLLAKLRGGHVA